MHIPKSPALFGVYMPMREPDAPGPPLRPTKETYDQLQQAYEHLNRNLFQGALPNCLITLQRRKRSYGYFAADRFGRTDGSVTDEIALNPSHFRSRPVAEVLATLGHEMVHLWQHHHGQPGRGRYHNKEWAAQMKAIGLQPTDTGEEGGKETGDSVHHYILPGGRFERAVKKLTDRGYTITWTEAPQPAASGDEGSAGTEGREQSKSGKRIKYTCPRCDLKAWAKHEAKLVCGEHMERMEPAS